MTLSYNPYALKREQWKRTPRKKDSIKERNPNALTFQSTSDLYPNCVSGL